MLRLINMLLVDISSFPSSLLGLGRGVLMTLILNEGGKCFNHPKRGLLCTFRGLPGVASQRSIIGRLSNRGFSPCVKNGPYVRDGSPFGSCILLEVQAIMSIQRMTHYRRSSVKVEMPAVLRSDFQVSLRWRRNSTIC